MNSLSDTDRAGSDEHLYCEWGVAWIITQISTCDKLLSCLQQQLCQNNNNNKKSVLLHMI